ALLFLGVSAAIANLDIHYDRQGLTVRTGWSQPRAVAAANAEHTAKPSDAPWKADLEMLERRMRDEVHNTPGSSAPQPVSAQRTTDAEMLRRVHALLDESEKRQKSELALRMAELLRDVNAQRQADLVKVNRALGAVENNLGVEVLKTRQQVNLMYRASQVR